MTENAYEEDDKKKTYPITFRIPEKLLEDLRREAEGAEVSLNTLVKQVFDRYMAWERHSSKIGLIPMTRPFLKEVVQYLPEQKIRQIARNASKDALKELVLIARGNFSFQSFISVFNEWLKASWMTYRYEYDNMVHHYVIHHGLGTKWSLYLAELLTAICMETMKIKPEIEIRRDSITFAVSSGIIDSEQLELISEKQTQ